MSDKTFNFIENYAVQNQLWDTLKSLPLVRDFMNGEIVVENLNVNGISRFRGHYDHALAVCKLLCSLVPSSVLMKDEIDIVLAAALCHVITNIISFEETCTMLARHQMSPHICRIIQLITNDVDLSEDGQREFYGRIEKDKLALIVFFADRAHLVQQLYNMSLWSAKEYIFETRTYFFPVCIRAKESYPELLPMINILMEKVRILVDASSILFNRYEQREMELTEDILNLQEENSRIRSILRTAADEQ